MNSNLKDTRLRELKEIFSRARFARLANVSDKIIKRVEEDGYIPREDTQAKILDAINNYRKRDDVYTTEQVFGKW